MRSRSRAWRVWCAICGEDLERSELMSHLGSVYSPLGIGRREAPACACPDVVGWTRWFEEGCPVHSDRSRSPRGSAAARGGPPSCAARARWAASRASPAVAAPAAAAAEVVGPDVALAAAARAAHVEPSTRLRAARRVHAHDALEPDDGAGLHAASAGSAASSPSPKASQPGEQSRASAMRRTYSSDGSDRPASQLMIVIRDEPIRAASRSCVTLTRSRARRMRAAVVVHMAHTVAHRLWRVKVRQHKNLLTPCQGGCTMGHQDTEGRC